MTERPVTEYDPRRPRIPVALAASIDAVRGQVSFNRWVVSRLAEALGVDIIEAAPSPSRPKPKPKPKPKAAPKPAPRMGRVLTSAQAKMLGRDAALAMTREKHAKRRASQRREGSQ